MDPWKALMNHQWDKVSYERGVAYLRELDPDRRRDVIKDLTKDERRSFRKKIAMYDVSVGPGGSARLVHVVHSSRDLPGWLGFSMAVLPMQFLVVHPDDKTSTISKLFSSEMTSAFNYKTIYDKLIKSKLLGISRSDVLGYLKAYPSSVRSLRNVGGNQFIKSYRPLRPFEHWQIDHIDLTKTVIGNAAENEGYVYILVIIDIFSKFVYLFPAKTKSAANVVACLTKVFMSGDIPGRMGLDRTMNTEPVAELLARFGVTPVVSKPYSPQTQGFVENKNAQIKTYISHHLAKYDSRRVFDILDQVAFSINTTKHAVTKVEPLLVHRGRLVNSTMNTHAISPIEQPEPDRCMEPDPEVVKHYVELDRSVQEDRVDHIRERIHRAAARRESQHRRRLRQDIETGSYVKVATFRKMGSDIKPVQLRLTRMKKTDGRAEYAEDPSTAVRLINRLVHVVQDVYKDVDTIKTDDKTKFKQIYLKSRRFAWEIPQTRDENGKILLDGFIGEPVFRVQEVVQEPHVRRYKIAFVDPSGETWAVRHLVDNFADQYARRFTKELLMSVPRPEGAQTYAERPEYNFMDVVDQQATLPQKTKAQQAAMGRASAAVQRKYEKYYSNMTEKRSKDLARVLFETHVQLWDPDAGAWDAFKIVDIRFGARATYWRLESGNRGIASALLPRHYTANDPGPSPKTNAAMWRFRYPQSVVKLLT